jgi:phosphoglycerate kinase
MNFKTLKDFDLKGKIVLLRADLNVPIDEDYVVTDTTRIDRLKPTIDYLSQQGAKTIILSHFGRPDGQKRPAYSLKFLLPELNKSWGIEVAFAEDCVGPEAKALKDSLKPGQVGLLENVRFHKGEEANDKGFAQELATLGDIYINDAFSAAHRAHASTEALAHILPAGAGFMVEAELKALHEALESPQKPVAAVVGGAKISTKLDVLNNLVEKVDMLVLGGGMANTFMHAMGIDVQASLCETDMTDQARAIMKKASKVGCDLVTPIDVVVDVMMKEKGVPPDFCAIYDVPPGHMILDIGPKTLKLLKEKLGTCKTVVWNGPLGAFEIKPFNEGTVRVARFVAEQTQAGKMKSVAGGGDTLAALEQAGVADKFTYVSTAGGAFLEWLEGKTLPGVAALCGLKDAA